MNQRVRHTALILSLILLFNEGSKDLHFIFFHHHDHQLEQEQWSFSQVEKEIFCPYENTIQLPGEPISLAHFYLMIDHFESIYLTTIPIVFTSNYVLGYHLRAPPLGVEAIKKTRRCLAIQAR